ncbi:tetratricopeptide repeat protein [Marinobacter sp. DUT-1]|uniref:tetratricopeptide repeat protein n=1 Tax=Marinobacter sp. DUT-1 TaxID=3412037 RepID=UPI003D17A06A
MSDFRLYRLLGVLGVLWLSGCAGPAVEQQAAEPEINPVLAAEHARRAMNAWEQGDRGAAVEAWRQALALNPEDPVAVNNLALALKEQHRFAEAAELLVRGVASSPGVAQLHYNLAVISELYLLELDKALTHYRAYQDLAGEEDAEVDGWIADLERRLQ